MLLHGPYLKQQPQPPAVKIEICTACEQPAVDDLEQTRSKLPTSVISTPGNRRCTLAMHKLDLHNIKFKHTHLKFTVYGHKQANKQAKIHTCAMQ